MTQRRCRAWVLKQMAKNLTDTFDGFLVGKRFLIMDRDTKFTDEFKALLKAEGVQPILCPVRAPNANAFAERFVLSIKSECLNRLILFGRGKLERAIAEFIEHYHRERNHQGIGNRLILPTHDVEAQGAVVSHKRLGGMLRFYYRKVA